MLMESKVELAPTIEKPVGWGGVGRKDLGASRPVFYLQLPQPVAEPPILLSEIRDMSICLPELASSCLK